MLEFLGRESFEENETVGFATDEVAICVEFSDVLNSEVETVKDKYFPIREVTSQGKIGIGEGLHGSDLEVVLNIPEPEGAFGHE